MNKTVVVITKPEVQLRVNGAAVSSMAGADVSSLTSALAELRADLRPIFGETVSRRASAHEHAGARPPEEALERFYELDVAEADAESVAERLAALPEVAGAYVQPEAVPAGTAKRTRERPVAAWDTDHEGINTAQPSAEPAPPATPSFVPRQLYRAIAPAGIDVGYAWTKTGGRGAGVGVIDCEGAWRFTHEDLLQNQGGVIGPQTSDLGWRNHGTAVVSVIGGDDNGLGVLGIAPDANVRGSSIFGPGGLAAALRAAADALRAGDIILIEVQYGHPVRGYTSVEWWPLEYAAIRYAIGLGVIVVEAAGNGGNNLDDPTYDTPLAGFPPDWRNAFRRGARDSGAVLVGAGAPPPGTHGRDHGPDRSRLAFSNFGAAIDVQGWGREVTSAGYGDLQGGADEDLWYSDTFSGTSSASPIVVGTLACLQGALRAAGKPLLTPDSARALLRSTGSPQQDAPGRPAGQRIGNRPNLRETLDRLLQRPMPSRNTAQDYLSSPNSQAQESIQLATSSIVEDAMRSMDERLLNEKFFPHGITKFAVSVSPTNGFSFTMEGPQQGSPPGAKPSLGFFGMEDVEPPPPPFRKADDPQPAAAAHIAQLEVAVAKSIPGAAALYSGDCQGGDRYKNNCAHFLSDAFIRAGYSELAPPAACIEARCSTSARRPIRARNMWCWFKGMATESRTTLPRNEGLWAVFQLDESQYWGGHVLIIDTTNNVYYGTANYPNWDQYFYRW